MKTIKCYTCNKEIEVYDEYEIKYCCPGRMENECGCGGAPINPMFCDKCEEKIFGKKEKYQ